MLSPLALEIGSAIVRALLLWFGSRLVEHGVLTHDQSDRAVEAALKHAVHYLPLLAIVAWSIRGKFTKHMQYLAARMSPIRATEEEVKDLAKQPVVKQFAFVDPAMIGAVSVVPPPRMDRGEHS